MRMHHLLAGLLLACILPGCALNRSTQGPMNSVFDRLACEIRPDTLIVFLPGAYDTPEDLIEQGFVSAVRQQKISADIQLVDAHIGYYNQRQIVQRLDEEIVAPARAQGYRNIWFVGISLGGYGTLLHAINKPGTIDGFFLMAPYLGKRDLPALIERQGGLSKWSVPNNQAAEDVAIWQWLQQYSSKSNHLPAAYLGYGKSDRFAQPNSVMADVLAPANRFVIAGGHDWATWKQLWNQFLTAAPLPRSESTLSMCGKP